MRRILLLGACLFMLSFSAYSQIKCTNKLLSDITEQLPDIGLSSGIKGEVSVPQLCKGKPLVIERNNNGDISHIGVFFFNRDIIEKHPSPVYHFVERYFLELLLLPSQEAISTKLHQERVSITSEAFSLKDYKKGLQDIISAVSHDLSVYITLSNNRYSVSCMENNKLLAQINFPMRLELITGYTKLESENSFYPSMLLHTPGEYQSPAEIDLSKYKETMYCLNDDFFAMEDIKSTSYYNKVGDKFFPLFSSDYMTESVFNLFNSRYDWKAKAEVVQSLYGNKNVTFEVPLATLIDYMSSNNCTIYTGIKKYDKKVIEGVVVAANMELGYQHLITFTMSDAIFQSPEANPVKIKMYCYVPIHNISSLFGENKF